MNWQKLLIAFIVVFVVLQVLSFVIHRIILDSDYKAITDVFRPQADMESKMWISWVTGLIFAFFFVYVFAKGYENKGIMEGIRYGLVIGCFMSIPSIYGQFMVYELPYSLILKWLFSDFITLVIIGIVAALIYKPQVQPA